ncbi:MAG: hypothetical protein DWQ02_03450 [Bacteroidetes bacterium]|nr:MAG: hypothetical protein DWQ02_03450 [Bacteroidota bacterium]
MTMVFLMKKSVNDHTTKLGYKCLLETILFMGLNNILIYEERQGGLLTIESVLKMQSAECMV